MKAIWNTTIVAMVLGLGTLGCDQLSSSNATQNKPSTETSVKPDKQAAKMPEKVDAAKEKSSTDQPLKEEPK